MRKSLFLFIIAILFLSFMMQPVYADSDVVFSLVNTTSKNNMCPDTHDFEHFWKALPLNFQQSSNDPDIYEAYGEASVQEKDLNGNEHSITGSVTATYDGKTGIFQGEYQLTHQVVVPPRKYSNLSGTITHEFSGNFEAPFSSGSKTVIIPYRGSWVQSVIGKPWVIQEGEEVNFSSTWVFSVGYKIEGSIPGLRCNPEVMGLDGLKPGDTLSPIATYFDIKGDEVDITQERWLINGVNTPPLEWDGQAAALELTWTCPDGKSYSASYSVPAFVAPVITTTPEGGQPTAGQPPEGNEEHNNAGDGLTPGGIAAIIAGAAGLLTGSGFLISHFIKGKPVTGMPSGKNAPPIPPQNPPQVPYNPAASVSPSSSVSTTFTPPPMTMQQNFPAQNQPAVNSSQSPQEIAQLSNIRSEMIQERERIKEKWRQTRDAMEKLKTIKKKNMIKFLLKQGLEVNNWIMDSPVEVINKVTIDPLMDKAFAKHDTSQDTNIIVTINNRILSLQEEMKDLVSQSKYLNNEISKLDRKLGKLRGK